MTIEEPTKVDGPSNMFSYSVKIVNPAKKADYSIRKFRVNTRFTSVQSLRKALSECFPMFIPNKDADIPVGYISPGHGARGKQHWITDDIDIEDMYKEHCGKKMITLWFYTDEAKKGKKRAHSPIEVEAAKRAKNRTVAHSEKAEEVETIVKELKEKHTGTYTEEKLRAWAHLIQMDKHKSYSQPPDMPYFKKGNKPSCVSDSTTPTHGISPSKRLTMRTACIEQMDKWHSLLQKGGITQQQYDQLQEKIMSDMLSM